MRSHGRTSSRRCDIISVRLHPRARPENDTDEEVDHCVDNLRQKVDVPRDDVNKEEEILMNYS